MKAEPPSRCWQKSEGASPASSQHERDHLLAQTLPLGKMEKLHAHNSLPLSLMHILSIRGGCNHEKPDTVKCHPTGQ